MKSTDCPHVIPNNVEPSGNLCEECGSNFNLRMCATCGHVGCCESQKGHNTAHARSANHPIIRSLPLSEKSFVWCYECKDYLK